MMMFKKLIIGITLIITTQKSLFQFVELAINLLRGDLYMPTEGKGRLFRRADDKYLIYLPKSLCIDSMFPLKNWQKGKRSEKPDSITVKVSFKMGGKPELLIEEWEGPDEGATDEESD